MEDLTKTWSKLKLSDCEGSSVRLMEKHAETEWVLAAKFLTRRALNLEAIAKTFSPLWRVKKGFKVRKEGEHLVLFTFKDQAKMLRVLAGEPWSFDKYMVVMQKYDGTTDVRHMKFDQGTFWVQVHDLPLRFRNQTVAEQLCEAMGVVNRSEKDQTMEGDRFVRVRVTLNISKPLCRGRVITLDDRKDLWIPFKYERLPNLYYKCGCLSHDERSCEWWNDSEGSLATESLQYGSWIKAAPFVPSKNKVVTVPATSETKKNGNPFPNLVQESKMPVVVLRPDNPSPKVIWPEKQEKNSNPPVMSGPNFQQTNSALPELNQGDKTEQGSVYASAEVLEVVAEAGNSLEVTLRALDKEIAMFDEAPGTSTETISLLGHHKSGPTNPLPHPNPKSPLANITNLSPPQDSPTSRASPKWTRQKRQVGQIENTGACNVALGKRIAPLPLSDSKPSKRRITVTRAGGLALLWKNSVSIKVVGSSLNFIDGIVNDGHEDSWRFTGIYGFPESSRKVETWQLLRELNAKYNLPWVCVGDFNEILRGHEKLGGSPRREVEMEAFREVVDELDLIDLGFTGKKFTWRGKRGESMILERLDRAFATPTWLERFPATRVQHLHSNASDHNPIIIKPEGIVQCKNKPFRFESMWMKEAGCRDTIVAAWGPPSLDSDMVLASSKINQCGVKLVEWSRTSFGSIKRQIAEASRLLALAEEVAARGAAYDQVQSLKVHINELLDQESMMWIQRARALYLQSGDRNTRFFHNRASQRYKRNQIHGLRNNQDMWCTSGHQLQELASSFYQDLFTTSRPGESHPIYDSVHPVVTVEMNSQLTRSFSREEVEAALKSMEPLSAPGPDGMPPTFFQTYWSLVGDDVSSTVLNCLNNCSMPAEINHTFITLIPKVKSPEYISQFRPISLCNVIYKLVSKVLANRLQGILPDIISENQSAFQAGRLISDNILMAYETLHYMKHQPGKAGFMALKLDMSKAYDRVEWSYLKLLMLKMGFHEKWVYLMMMCITTVSYSILINGEPSGKIVPSRGLRQGDPISPYLFLLCSEGLHALIEKAALEGHIRGISLCRNGPRLTHLFFADDSLLFCRASIQECNHIQAILSDYEKASGQKLNREKQPFSSAKQLPQIPKKTLLTCLGFLR
ncbi:hypothetical protein SO802_017258 [Lithocarpus litseifolius]|uniref:Reverse transcriptase domain-containing protein n=1 Tax=Lithocarpus litseifolius TaxID=425828 RepID=A0AAW2CZG4_9ROSI